ncbi:hypothetical protein BUALT_Bualt10G0050200 [Buddleja alternifolia]|uniref:Uncharacterized protein n=1 Tax=Buddleja alternifolia TaxID=168488 RepID=A0AAV6X3E7_9LAMI|nr:hypothetical protein BUALT_Bualt10G0050200 [Buddleja alternifolia]
MEVHRKHGCFCLDEAFDRITIHNSSHPQEGAAQNLVAKKKQQSVDWVKDIVRMEKLTEYTCNPEYINLWNKLMSHQNAFMEIVNDQSKPTKMKIDKFGEIDVGHLRSHVVVVQEAFDLKMSVQNLVNKEMEMEIIKELMAPEGNGLEESPYVAEKRKRMKNSI